MMIEMFAGATRRCSNKNALPGAEVHFSINVGTVSLVRVNAI
jgi:hypothetical protein